jgi:flagellar biosynthesis protein FlhF
MNVRTYRASTMREALDLVRRELGSDAIIFSTRQSPVRRRFPWQRARETAEVVAGVAEQTAPLRQSTGRLASMEIGSAAGSDPTPLSTSVVAQGAAPTAAHPTEPNEELAALIQQLGHRVRSYSRREIPDELFHLYTRLIDADVYEQDARELVLELPSELRSSPSALQPALEALIERSVACCGPIRVTPGVRTVAALVGPTGVGKTTTVAKLAANFKLRDGVKVGLVTVDTYRVAAVEQLRTYAELIDLPMHVVSSPREMRAALQQLDGMDLVLIDTAGRSPRDEVKIQELKSYLAEADVDQVHLVLSLVAGARSLEQAAEKFRTVGVTSLLLTKLDEAAGAGSILSAAKRITLPISYLTNGQDVPDDIEPAATPHVARLILDAIESSSA